MRKTDLQGARVRLEQEEINVSVSPSGHPIDESDCPDEAAVNRPSAIAFIVLAMVLLAIPLVCMSFARTETTTENRVLAAWPSLTTEEGAPNVDYLMQMGAYFEDHFAFRNELVSADAELRSALFGVSASPAVVDGTDGWLYYGGTLDDYLRREEMSDRSLDNVAFNLKLMQDKVEQSGAAFAFTIAPDKASLYPEHMPFYYQPADGVSNAVALKPFLEKHDVRYADQFAAFSAQRESLYFKRDTHWNNKGAALAYATLLDAVGINHPDYLRTNFASSDDYIGDLGKMLYPVTARPESSSSCELCNRYELLDGASSVEESWIETDSTAEGGTLLMYRDSFGNALLPYMASTFREGYFSKLTPYDLGKLSSCKPTCVIVERAERNISYLDQSAFVMQGPTVATPENLVSVENATTLDVGTDGTYTTINGVVDERFCKLDTRIFVRISSDAASGDTTYLPFHITVSGDTPDAHANDYGYCLYLRSSSVPPGPYRIEVIISAGDENEVMATKMVDR